MTRKPIDIFTNRYEIAHGKLPRGHGAWAFIVHDASTKQDVETFFTPAMNFSDAKVWAKAHIRDRHSRALATGYLDVYVGS